jgi:hypothetical protein
MAKYALIVAERSPAPAVEVPRTVRALPVAEVRDRLPLEVPIGGGQEMTEEEVLGRDGSVGLELPYPVAGGGLQPQEVVLRALERRIDSARIYHWSLIGQADA